MSFTRHPPLNTRTNHPPPPLHPSYTHTAPPPPAYLPRPPIHKPPTTAPSLASSNTYLASSSFYSTTITTIVASQSAPSGSFAPTFNSDSFSIRTFQHDRGSMLGGLGVEVELREEVRGRSWCERVFFWVVVPLLLVMVVE